MIDVGADHDRPGGEGAHEPPHDLQRPVRVLQRRSAEHDDHPVALHRPEHVQTGDGRLVPDGLELGGGVGDVACPRRRRHRPRRPRLGWTSSPAWRPGTARSRRSRPAAPRRPPTPPTGRPRCRAARRPARRSRPRRRPPRGCRRRSRVQHRPVGPRHHLVDLGLDHVDRGAHQLDGLMQADPSRQLTRGRAEHLRGGGPGRVGIGEPGDEAVDAGAGDQGDPGPVLGVQLAEPDVARLHLGDGRRGHGRRLGGEPLGDGGSGLHRRRTGPVEPLRRRHRVSVVLAPRPRSASARSGAARPAEGRGRERPGGQTHRVRLQLGAADRSRGARADRAQGVARQDDAGRPRAAGPRTSG